MKSKMIAIVTVLSVSVFTANAAGTYTVEAFHDGTEAASGELVDMYTGVTGIAQALDDVTDPSLMVGLVEVDSGLSVCGTTVQLHHGKRCVGVPTYVAAKQ